MPMLPAVYKKVSQEIGDYFNVDFDVYLRDHPKFKEFFDRFAEVLHRFVDDRRGTQDELTYERALTVFGSKLDYLEHHHDRKVIDDFLAFANKLTKTRQDKDFQTAFELLRVQEEHVRDESKRHGPQVKWQERVVRRIYGAYKELVEKKRKLPTNTDLMRKIMEDYMGDKKSPEYDKRRIIMRHFGSFQEMDFADLLAKLDGLKVASKEARPDDPLTLLEAGQKIYIAKLCLFLAEIKETEDPKSLKGSAPVVKREDAFDLEQVVTAFHIYQDAYEAAIEYVMTGKRIIIPLDQEITEFFDRLDER